MVSHLDLPAARRACAIASSTFLLLLATPSWSTTCDDDTCTGSGSTLQAVAHSHTDPSGTILYRARIPAWSPATAWGDGSNGFFYQVTVTGGTTGDTARTYVPFNGVGVGSDGQPRLPSFSFVIAADSTASGIHIEACSTNYSANVSDDPPTPPCSQTYWSDAYDALPAPQVGCPPSALGGAQLLEFSPSSVSIAFNGVYAATSTLVVDPASGTSLDDESVTWLYDHLLFFDQNLDPYRNDIFDTDLQSVQHRSLGVLELEDGAYVDPTDGSYRTKYGSGTATQKASDPDRAFVFYSADEVTTDVIEPTVGYVYDASADCRGWIENVGSLDACSTVCSAAPGAAPPTNSDLLPITVAQSSEAVGNDIVAEVEDGQTAGSEELRTLQFQATEASGAACGDVSNPLAIFESGVAYNPPNYVLDDRLSSDAWDQSFGVGAYYVGATGFGPCAGALPFCERETAYAAYVPHYLDESESGGTRNGGSTTKSTVGSAVLSDQYEVGALGQETTTDYLVYFDNCGFGYTYTETVPGGQRQRLPDPPSGWDTLLYTVTNDLSSPVVFAKECCASYYQKNETTSVLEPPQAINDSYGVFVPPGETLDYDTLFHGEWMTVYDAFTGNALFKLLLGEDGAGSFAPKIYGCADAGTTVSAGEDSGIRDLVLGGGGTDALTCQSLEVCPPGMKAGRDGAYATCTATTSSFLFGLQDWATEAFPLASSLQVRAWGARGKDATNATASSTDGLGGAAGFALTVIESSDLPAALYAYVGTSDSSTGTVLIDQPLSLVTSETAESVAQPEIVGTWLIAGGGGGGASTTASTGQGGAGACAVANDTPGTAVSGGGDTGAGGVSSDPSEPGVGGNRDSSLPGKGGKESGTNGIGGWGDSKWDQTGSLLPPQSWSAGKGGVGEDASLGSHGGGGFGGGGGSVPYAGEAIGAGGGGGGSWAAANTVTDESAPTCSSLPSAPSDGGAVQLAYLQPPCSLDESGSRPIVRCSYAATLVGENALDVQATVAALFGDDTNVDAMPVYVEAWGGSGGAGGYAKETGGSRGGVAGGAGGGQGYARSSQTWQELLSLSDDGLLNFYVGVEGASGPESEVAGVGYGLGGAGGSSTVVATTALDATGASDPRSAGVLVVAGGGGGGGGGTLDQNLYVQGVAGGRGGEITASTDADASGAGAQGFALDNGRGGADGTGGCASGQTTTECGADGIGGLGGASAGAASTTWEGGSGSWTAGLGGAGFRGWTGSGGGGFGGGAAGGTNDTDCLLGASCGGGGGGSWARQSTVDDADAPVVDTDDLGAVAITGQGAVVLSFDVCALDPSNASYCSDDAPGFVELHEYVAFARQGDHAVTLLLRGSSLLDVTQIDLDRLVVGPSMRRPESADRARVHDVDGDGSLDLQLRLESASFPIDSESAAYCALGALRDGTAFVGCASARGEISCPATPTPGCIAGFADARLRIDERRQGREKLIARLRRGPSILPEDLGDPTRADGTGYALCLFDASDELAGELVVARAGETCGSRPCWKSTSEGFRYQDANASASGIHVLDLDGDAAGSSAFSVRARNQASRDRSTLPLGIAAALSDTESVRMQLLSSDAECFEATLDRIDRQTEQLFRAR